MKKHVILATGLAVLSTSAYATTTRLNALGQGTTSFYLQDTKNVFLNPASLNNTKNYVTTEWGSNGAGNAEGGFFREAGSFSYGLYLGNDTRALDTERAGGNGFAGAVAMGESGFLTESNQVDLFFAGDMGMQWGVGVHYATGENKTSTLTKEQSSLGLSAGVVMGDLTVHGKFDLKNESKGASEASDKFEAGGMNIGATYAWNNINFFVDMDKQDIEYTDGSNPMVKSEQTTLTVGAAKVHNVTSTARVIFDARYTNVAAEDVDGAGAKTEKTTTSLPLTVAFETEANSWLTLRGSASQKVLINNIEDKTSTTTTESNDENSTTVNAGATLNFGKLKIDGTIGVTDNAGTKQGTLRLDQAMADVAVTYWF